MLKKLEKAKNLLFIGVLPLSLIGFGAIDKCLAAEPAASTISPTLSPHEFAAALAGKFQLLKVRTTQLNAINKCFFRVSDDALAAKKKGEELSRTKAKELLQAYGITEAFNIDKPLAELKDNPTVGKRSERLLELVKKSEKEKVEAEFLALEKEIRTDIVVAKSMGIDTATFNKDLTEYARSRVESLMWNAIFNKKETPAALKNP